MKKVLCLAGGGVRGYAQIQVLKQLENEYGKPLCEVYDLVCGSSVGAINAAIISTSKITMNYLEKLYPKMIKKIFKKRGLFKIPRYDRQNFIDAWTDLIGYPLFGDAKTKLMLTSVDLVSDQNHFFKSWHDDDAKELMCDIIIRSFAAPYYFGHIVDNKNKKCWSDGGIGNANLPLNEVKTQVESFQWYDVQGKGNNTVLIDAIGCLEGEKDNNFDKIKKHRWLKQILDYMNPINGGLARAQSLSDQVRMMQYLSKNNTNLKFRYWNITVPEKINIIDGVKYVDEYKKYGEYMSNEPLVDLS